MAICEQVADSDSFGLDMFSVSFVYSVPVNMKGITKFLFLFSESLDEYRTDETSSSTLHI